MQIFQFPQNDQQIRAEIQRKKDKSRIVHGNIWDIGASFDIETTQINCGDIHHAYMYIWQYALDDMVVYGRTWDAYMTFYRLLVKELMLGKPIYPKRRNSPKYKLMCLVHNLAFEFQFLSQRHRWQVKRVGSDYLPNIFSKDAHNVISAVTKENMEYRCTLNLTGKSLRKLAEDYNLESRKKVGQLDYSKPRNSMTPLTDAELEYCFFDVIILSEFYHKYFAPTYLYNGGTIPTTRTSIIRNELKAHFKDINAEYPKGFPSSQNVYKWLMTWVFRGGYVHANAFYTAEEIIELLFSYDFKSSYPARMLLNDFPYEFKEINELELFEELDNIQYNHSKIALIFTAKFRNIRSKFTHSLESKHKCIELVGEYVDNGRIAKADSMTVSLTEQDYLNYKDCYTWDKMELVGACFKAEKKPLPQYLLDLTCKYYYIKSTIDPDLHPLDYMLSKGNVNGLYGMCCSSIYHDNYVFDGTEMSLQPSEIDFDKVASKQILLPQWGVYISAYARREEIRHMITLGIDGAYGDTDSWKVRNPSKYESIFDIYNDMICDRLISRDFSKLDFKYIGCKDEADLKAKIMGIGKFEHESNISRFKTLGCKRYIMMEDKGKGEKIVCKCAGMKSDNFLKKEKRENRSDDEIFNDFDFNLTLSPSESGKMAHHYNNELHEDIIVDEFGNSEKMSEKSSICLYAIPFKMRAFDDYIAFYTELQEQLGRKY